MPFLVLIIPRYRFPLPGVICFCDGWFSVESLLTSPTYNI